MIQYTLNYRSLNYTYHAVTCKLKACDTDSDSVSVFNKDKLGKCVDCDFQDCDMSWHHNPRPQLTYSLL